MAITDAQLRFSNAQSLAGAAATTLGTNVIPLLSDKNNLGIGANRRVLSKVVEAFAGGTSVRAELIESAASDLSSPTVIYAGPTIADAAAVVGAHLLDVVIPTTSKKYLGVRFVTLGTHTTGKVFAGIVLDADHQPYLPMNTGR